MKKLLAILMMVMFSIGVLSLGCGADDGTCTSNDVDQCRSEQADCMRGSTSENVDECGEVLCDCLDDNGCSDYLEAAGC